MKELFIQLINNQLFFVLIDILIYSLLAFFSILTFSRARKISVIFFVITALFMFLIMVVRILDELKIFSLSVYTVADIPVLQQALYDLPALFMVIGFILLLKDK